MGLRRAGVVELVDAPDSKSGSERSVGSIPTTRTIPQDQGKARRGDQQRGDGKSHVEADAPWHLHLDRAVARSLGFQPTVRTVSQAAQEMLL